MEIQPLESAETTPNARPAGGVVEPSAASEPASAAQVLEVLDRLADGYYEMDADFRYRRVNPAALAIVGKSREEMIGKRVLEVFPDVAQAEVHRAVVRVMERRQAEGVELYYAPHHRWYVNTIYPVGNGVAVFSRDITEQKALEQNLAFLAEASKILSSSLDFQTTLRAVARIAVPDIADWCAVDMLTGQGTVEPLAVAHVDPDKVRWAEELRSANPVDLDGPQGLPKVLRTGRPEFYPAITDAMLVAMSKDERSLELARSIGFSSAMVVPLLVRDAAIGAITFVTAESGRHYTPADLRIAVEVASRAALAIENSRLYTESQRAVALRDDFISVASHELNTPVTSMKVYTEVLKRQAEQRGDEQTSRHLGKMNDQISRLSLLISDLLDVSRIEAGKLELRPEDVDLERVVVDAVEAVEATTARQWIAIEGSIRRPVVGDRERLGQVVTNLLTNAVKYSPAADRIVVRLTETEVGALVEVEDFGIGIAAEHLDHIFERFYRVSSADEKTFPGLGMGLHISSEIVRRHGGTIGVTSEKGKGSTFRFVVPFAAAAPPDDAR